MRDYVIFLLEKGENHEETIGINRRVFILWEKAVKIR